MTSGQNEQIVQAFEELELQPAEIADQLGLEVTAVKACLLSFSSKYRRESDKDIELDFSCRELKEANETLVRLMRHSEDEHLQFKVARYIRDDKKGRLDIGKNLANVQMTANIFNQYLIQAKDALQATSVKKITQPSPAAAPQQEAIDV